jgi:hypothetical protein
MNAHEGKTADAIAYFESIKVQFAATMDPKFRASLDLLVNRARIHDQIRTALKTIVDAIEETRAAIPQTLFPTPSVTAVIPIELVNNAHAWLQTHRDLESPPLSGNSIACKLSDEHDA